MKYIDLSIQDRQDILRRVQSETGERLPVHAGINDLRRVSLIRRAPGEAFRPETADQRPKILTVVFLSILMKEYAPQYNKINR